MTQRKNTSSLRPSAGGLIKRKSKKKFACENYSLYTAPQVRKKFRVDFPNYKTKKEEKIFKDDFKRKKRKKIKKGSNKFLKSNLYKKRKKTKKLKKDFSLHTEPKLRRKYVFKPKIEYTDSLTEKELEIPEKPKKKKKGGSSLVKPFNEIKSSSKTFNNNENEALIPLNYAKNSLVITNNSLSVMSKSFSFINNHILNDKSPKIKDEKQDKILKKNIIYKNRFNINRQSLTRENSSPVKTSNSYSFTSPKLKEEPNINLHKSIVYRKNFNNTRKNKDKKFIRSPKLKKESNIKSQRSRIYIKDFNSKKKNFINNQSIVKESRKPSNLFNNTNFTRFESKKESNIKFQKSVNYSNIVKNIDKKSINNIFDNNKFTSPKLKKETNIKFQRNIIYKSYFNDIKITRIKDNFPFTKIQNQILTKAPINKVDNYIITSPKLKKEPYTNSQKILVYNKQLSNINRIREVQSPLEENSSSSGFFSYIGKNLSEKPIKIASSTTRNTIKTSTKILEQNLNEEAVVAMRPATSILKFASSTLKAPKQIHKNVYEGVKYTLKDNLTQNISEDIKEVAKPVEEVLEIAKLSGKATLNTVKLTYQGSKFAYKGGKFAAKVTTRTVKSLKNKSRLKTSPKTEKLAEKTAKGTLIAAKTIMLMIKFKKIIAIFLKATIAAVKIASAVVKAVVAAVKIVAKAVAAVVALVGIKVIAAVAAIVAVIAGFVFLIIGFISATIPDATSEELSGYILLIRELDSEVNEHIRYQTEHADEVIFSNREGGHNHDAPVYGGLNTNLHHFFAIFAVYFEGNWDYAEDSIRILHSRTFSLNIDFIYYFDSYIEYYIQRAIVVLHIYTIEEMMINLGLDEEEQYLLLYIIEHRNLQQFFPDLYDYFFGEHLHGLSPSEIAYILNGTPIAWPTHSQNITSPFGYRTLGGVTSFHHGIDIGIPIGTPVFASVGGRVINSFFSQSGGNMIVIQNEQGIVTRYLHLDERLVHDGDIVGIGYLIGRSGNTGHSTGPHLHYDIAINGTRVNPLLFLP